MTDIPSINKQMQTAWSAYGNKEVPIAERKKAGQFLTEQIEIRIEKAQKTIAKLKEKIANNFAEIIEQKGG